MKALGKKPPAHCHFSEDGEYNVDCNCRVAPHYRQALIEAADECDRLFMDWVTIKGGNHPEVFVALERKLRISAGKD